MRKRIVVMLRRLRTELIRLPSLRINIQVVAPQDGNGSLDIDVPDTIHVQRADLITNGQNDQTTTKLVEHQPRHSGQSSETGQSK